MTKNTRIRIWFLGMTCCGIAAYLGAYQMSHSYYSEKQQEIARQEEQRLESQFHTDSSDVKEETAEAGNIPSQKTVMFLLKETDGYLTVYLADGETLYTTTDIKPQDLELELQEELKNGISIYSIDELYEWLESYST